MTKPSSVRLSEKLAALRVKYVAQLQQDFPLQTACLQDTPSTEQRHELQRYLHRLAGSGGSYGLARISSLSKAAELILLEQANSETLETTTLNTLRGLVLELGNEVIAADTPAPIRTAALPQESSMEDVLAPSIWILDDDTLLLAQLAEQLSSFGFRVATFANFEHMVAAWTRNTPDFLLADVNLGTNNDFYAQFEQAELDLSHTQLIMLSSYDSFDARIKAVRARALTYVQKPVDCTRLANLVRDNYAQNKRPPERVLLLDDDTELAELYRVSLQAAGMQVICLEHPAQIMQAIHEHQPELIIIDLYMPEYNGMELASLVRQFDAYASTPIVYLSAEQDNERQAAALERGADDFMTKPIDPPTLINSVRLRIRRARQLQALINKDSLTGLLKHSSIKEALRKELVRCKRTQEPLAVCMLDIDHFKKVNDTYGHAVGDTVIASLAILLSQRLRQTDSVGRYGGEEFMLVLPGCSVDAGQSIIEDIRQRFSSIRFSAGQDVFHCTLSAGFCVFKADDHGVLPEIETLIERADTALYEAKRGGRNQVIAARS